MQIQHIKDIPTLTFMNEDYYFYWAYGSNLNQRQMAYRCPKSLPISRATLNDYHLLFRGNYRNVGVATIEKMEGSQVPGAVWALHKDDLFAMDRYEGFPRLYIRQNIIVKSNDTRKPMEVMTYVMHETFDLQQPSREYLDTIHRGYRDFNLDTKILRDFHDKQTQRILQQNLYDYA